MYCKSCNEEIKRNAKKCKHCGSYQDFRRHLNLGNNFLALLLALISVSTVLFTQLNSIANQKTSNSYVEAFILNPDGISLIISNSGNMPSFIHNVKLEVYDSVQLIKTYNLTLDDRNGQTRIIKPDYITESFFLLNTDWFKQSICEYLSGSRKQIHDGERFICKVKWTIASYDSNYERISIYDNKEKTFPLKDLAYTLRYSQGGFVCPFDTNIN